jgi:flagellar hook-associated protein 3 FlgL
MINGTRYRLNMDINRQIALSRDIARSQIEVSTGKRVQAPSDDPVAAARIASIARSQANDTAFKSNLNLAFALAARADTTLKSVGTALDRAGELMVQGANGTLSDGDRATIALELRSIAEDIGALKATKDTRGSRLFMSGGSLRIPVASGVSIEAVGTREDVFESVPTQSGPQDLAAIVSAAADALSLTNPAARAAAVATSADAVGAAVEHVANARGAQGALGSRIDQLIERQADFGLQLEEERSNLESADVTAAIARVQSRQLTLQAAQAVFARVNAATLFDILR